MSWNTLIGPWQRRFRRSRAQRILARYPDIVGSRVVDIGGSLPFWQNVDAILRPAEVVIYNISDHRMNMGERNVAARIRAELYDGVRVPEGDGSADFVICNSVIEHVPPAERENLAREIRRVGRNFIVQTPSPQFPLELHFGLPFIHWLPRRLGRTLAKASPFALLAGADAQRYFDETRLVGIPELAKYFPRSTIEIERFAGLPKSLIAFGAGDVLEAA